MKVAFGMKVHSGWAALAVVGNCDGDLAVVDRRRLEPEGCPTIRFLGLTKGRQPSE